MSIGAPSVDLAARAEVYEQFIVTPLALAIVREMDSDHDLSSVTDSSIMEYDAPSYVSMRIESVLANVREIDFWETYADAMESENSPEKAADIAILRFRETELFLSLIEAIVDELGVDTSTHQW